MPRGHKKGYRKACRHCFMVMRYHDAIAAFRIIKDNSQDENYRLPFGFKEWLRTYDWSNA